MTQPQSYRDKDGTALTQRSDEALVELTRDGQHQAFAVLLKRYEPRVFNYIRRIVGNAGDAEDLFQETFLRVYRNLHRFRPGAPFRPWMYRIATNLCKDHLKYMSHRRHLSLDAQSRPDGPPLGDAFETNAPSPRAVALTAELAQFIEQAIHALPIKHRTVFVMARYEQLSYADIAKTLKIPVGTVKSRMNKAVHVLAHAMKEREA